jgi:acyl-CoA thioester hydrolase
MTDDRADNTRYVHRIRVRYGEVDMQGVVFNAHYLAYCDDAVENWLQARGVQVAHYDWDFMLKKATVEWQGAATVHEVLDIEVGVQRWGSTSFDVAFTGRVGQRPVFRCVITYVGVGFGTKDKAPPPPEVRARLSDPPGSENFPRLPDDCLSDAPGAEDPAGVWDASGPS